MFARAAPRATVSVARLTSGRPPGRFDVAMPALTMTRIVSLHSVDQEQTCPSIHGLQLQSRKLPLHDDSRTPP